MDNKTNDDDDEIYATLNDYFILFSPCIFISLFVILFYLIRKMNNKILQYKENKKLINLEYDDNMTLNESCSICLDKLNIIDIEKGDSIILKTKCNHIFHRYCIINDSIINCPICREPIKFKSYYHVDNIAKCSI